MSVDYKIILSALNQTAPAFDSVRRDLGSLTGLAKTAALGLAGIGAGLSLNAVASQFSKVIDSAAELKDLAERTGSTVEQMGALARAAKLTGTDVGAVETSVIKLTKALYATDEGSGATARALEAIGLSVKQLRGLDPAEAFRLVAEKLNGFADSADKTAVAMALFGKNGAAVLPFIKDLGELGAINTKITREQAEAADQYQKAMIELTASFDATYKSLVMNLLPTMNEFLGTLVKGKEAGLGLVETLALLARDKFVVSAPEALSKALKDLDRLEKDRAAANNGIFGGSGFFARNLDTEIARKKSEIAYLRSQLDAADAKSQTGVNERLRDQAMSGLIGSRKINFSPPAAAANSASNVDPLADAAKSYASVMNDITRAQMAAIMSGEDYTATQKRLIAVMTSPEWLQMPESWRIAIGQQGEAAIAAEKTAAAQKRLNDLLAATPTAKLEAQRDTMQFLAQAFEDGKISADQFTEAAQAALGTLPEQIKKNEDAFAGLTRAIEGFGRDSAAAIVDFAFTGKMSVGNMVESILKDLARLVVYEQITKPLAGAVTDALPGLGSLFGGGSIDAAGPLTDFAYLANGGAYESRSLSAYSGGVYDSPRLFAFAGGAGVFGEAGPEAIMPLKRGRDGKLGVAASGSGDVTINVTVAADGAASNDGVGNLAQLGTVIANVVRAELINQKRPGGLLAA